MGKKRKVHSNTSENDNTRNKMWGGSSSGSSRRKARGSQSSSRVNETAIINMFTQIADEDDPSIANMEGVVKLCEDLEIDPFEDVRVLVLLWKLGASEKPGQISKDEWVKGCVRLELDSIQKIKQLLPSLETGFIEQHEFKSFYKFAFQFNREGTHRTLDKDLVIMLLKLVLKDRVTEERLKDFSEFLESNKEEANNKINLDQWSSFLDFCLEVKNIDDYDDEMSAWPILIDDFVEYIKTKK